MITSEHSRGVLASPPLVETLGVCDNFLAGKASSEATANALDRPSDPKLWRQSKINRQKSSTMFNRVTSRDRPPDLSAVVDQSHVSTPKERNQSVVKLIANHRLQNLCNEEETILELYHANLSMHQLGTLVDQLLGMRLSLSAITILHRKVIHQIEAWRERPIRKVYPYVFLAGIELKCSCGYEKKQASVLTAVGVNENGVREVLGVTEGATNSNASWCGFLQQLKSRGLCGVRLFIGDRCVGLAERLALIFPGMHFQSNVVQFHHDVLAQIPIGHLLGVEKMLERIDASKDWSSASKLVAQMVADLKRLKLTHAAHFYETHVWESMNHLAFPSQHRHVLRSNSALIKLLRKIRERTRMVGAFSDGTSAVHLVSARMRHIEATVWSEKRHARGRL